MRRFQGLALAFSLLCAAVLAVPGVASGLTLCVNKGGAQCDQAYAAAQIKDAFAAANANQMSHDRIEIGPGVYPQGPYNAASNVEIVGAGMDETVLTHSGPAVFNQIILLANFGEPVIRDLTVRLGAGESARGLQVASALVERVRVEALPGSDPSPAMDAFGVTARDIEVSAPMNGTALSGGGLIEDSVISGGTALSWIAGVARRLRLTGKVAARMSGGRLENSVLTTTGPDAVGLALPEFFTSNVDVSHVTVVGDGKPGGVGLLATKSTDGTFNPLSSTLDVVNSVVTGFPVGLRHRGAPGDQAPCNSTCQVTQNTTVSWSLIEGSIDNQGGPGQLTLGQGLRLDAKPSFVNRSAADFRPRFDSPLVDGGEPVGLGQGPFYLNESPLTIDGAPRLIAGKAGATVPRRDIGALEYRRQAPRVSLDGPSQRVLLYRPVQFRAEGSDADGDPLDFEFDFGEGTGAEPGANGGPNTNHSFLSLGTKRVKVTASDPTGLAAVASTEVRVAARPGRCANRRSGGGGPDRFNGSPAGDDLRGRGGPDALRGARGADCLIGGAGGDRLAGGPGPDRLVGGAGRDTLVGGPGRDILNGGAGSDRITGGPGPDRIAAGRGNDRINVRGGGRDVVNCGAGRRDRVIADRRDRVRGCEIVRR